MNERNAGAALLFVLLFSFIPGSSLAGQSIVIDGLVVDHVTGNSSSANGGGATMDADLDPSNNSIAIDNSTVTGRIHGGYYRANSGDSVVEGNTISINDSFLTFDVGRVYGGFAASDVGSAKAAGNSVTLGGNTKVSVPPTLNDFVVGGYAESESDFAEASDNTVTISDGVQLSSFYGGRARSYAGSTKAANNTAIMNGGTVEEYIFGGRSYDSAVSEVTNNRVEISGGSVALGVFGGLAAGDALSSATVTGNTVVVSGGTVGGMINGGRVDADASSVRITDNHVILSGGKITGHVFAGRNYRTQGSLAPETAFITNNTVTISGSVDLTGVDVYGGFIDYTTIPELRDKIDVFTGNTLNKNSGTAMNNAHNFEFINFGYDGDSNMNAVNWSSGDVKLNTGGHSVNFNTRLNGGGSLTKIGTGRLNFDRDQFIREKLTIAEGALSISDDIQVATGELVFGAGSEFRPDGHTLTALGLAGSTFEDGASLYLHSADEGNVILNTANGTIKGYFDDLFYDVRLRASNTELYVAGSNSVNDIIKDLRDAGVTIGQNGSNGLGVIHNVVNKADDELRDQLYDDLNRVIDMARDGDPDGASIALEQILGQYGTRGMEANQAIAQSFSGSIFGHLSQMRDTRTAMRAAGADSALASMNGHAAANRVWAAGFGTFTRQGDADGAHGYDYDAGGLILGYDRQFGRNITAGFTGAYSRGRVEGNEGYSRTDIDSLNLGLYAGYDPQCGFYAEANLGFGRTWNEDNESLLLGGDRRGKYNTSSFQAGGNIGYAFRLPSAFRVIPTVGAQYIRVRQQEHGQTGSGLLMWRDAADAEYLEIPFSVRVNKTFDLANGMSITPELRAAWIHGAKRDAATVRARYVGSTESFLLSGANPGRNRGLAGAGMKVRFNRTLDAFVEYNLEFRRKYRSHAIMAGAGVSF